jgi:hypothetical protein
MMDWLLSSVRLFAWSIFPDDQRMFGHDGLAAMRVDLPGAPAKVAHPANGVMEFLLNLAVVDARSVQSVLPAVLPQTLAAAYPSWAHLRLVAFAFFAASPVAVKLLHHGVYHAIDVHARTSLRQRISGDGDVRFGSR